ncbi:hypothetical protein HAX54_038570 [Datura stramonium]|uniref:Uncharacterized protein n=1 Tax=Datura stramonium TaxID=4076 RepID=A0ABS8SI67_DATST|nr:hypothetical protein [Datura stramonium]
MKFNLANEFPYSFVTQEITPNDLDNGAKAGKFVRSVVLFSGEHVAFPLSGWWTVVISVVSDTDGKDCWFHLDWVDENWICLHEKSHREMTSNRKGQAKMPEHHIDSARLLCMRPQRCSSLILGY